MKKQTIVPLSILALAVTACGEGNANPPSPGEDTANSSADNSIVIGSWGGDADEVLQQSVHTFLDEYGDVEPTLDGADTATRRTQLITEGDAETGSWDIIALAEQDIADLADEGLLQTVDQDLIANYENISEDLINEHCVPQYFSPLTIIYNADELDLNSNSWEAAFSEDVLTQSGVNTSWSDYYVFAAAILEAEGDPGSDMSTGYDRVADIASIPRSYGSPTQLGQGLMTNEVDATIGPRSRAAQWADESGLPFESVVPDEGTFNSTFYYCIPANAGNPDAAHNYLDAVLDPRGQEFFAENFYYAPSVTNVDLDPDVAEAVSVTAEEAERTWSPDMGEISEQSAEFRSLWDEHS